MLIFVNHARKHNFKIRMTARFEFVPNCTRSHIAVSEHRKRKHPHLAICKDDDSRHGGDGKVGRQVTAVLCHHLQDSQVGLLAGAVAASLLHLFQQFGNVLAGTSPEWL